MNEQQKTIFYKFLGLYLISSYILLIVVAVLYYNAQIQLAHVDVHFKLHEQSDKIQGKLKDYLIQNKININTINKDFLIKDYKIDFINKNAKTLGLNSKTYPKKILHNGTFDINHACLVVKQNYFKTSSDIWGYVITDTSLDNKIINIRNNVFFAFFVIAILIAILGYFLSKLFLKPINDYIENLNNFIKDMNHELNTPITSLMMTSKELNKKFNDSLVKSIIISTKQLFEIYQTLIDINFNIKNNSTRLNLKEQLNESIEYFNEILISKNIKISTDINDFYYEINKEKIQRVFNNLISNAIKYSYPNSSINISLKNNILVIEDYGIGIDESLQNKIFDRFYTQHKDTRGFGIGLDVIKKITYAYKIHIQVKSQKGKGTSFILTF